MTTETKVITATTKAADAIGKATVGMAKVVAELGSMVQDHGDLMDQITEAQQELNHIKANTDTASREAAAELKLRIKENRHSVLLELLQEQELAHISIAKLSELGVELRDAKLSNEKEVSKAVAIAVNQAKSAADKSALEAESDHKVAVAEKDASINAKDLQISFMEKQIKSLEETIEKERQARVSIAASESMKQGVTLHTNGK